MKVKIEVDVEVLKIMLMCVQLFMGGALGDIQAQIKEQLEKKEQKQ